MSQPIEIATEQIRARCAARLALNPAKLDQAIASAARRRSSPANHGASRARAICWSMGLYRLRAAQAVGLARGGSVEG
jgi:hypothetical protein